MFKDIMRMIFGGGDKFKSSLAPWQQELQRKFSQGIENNPLYNQGNDYIMNLLSGDPSAFAAFEAPFKQQFEQQTVPHIAERFAGAGTGGGAMSSSALNNSLSQAGSELSTNLAALRGGLQMQALPMALQYAQQPFNNYLQGMNVQSQYYQPGNTGFIGQLLQALAQAGGQQLAKSISGDTPIGKPF